MFPAARIGDPITHDMLVPSGLIGPAAPAPCPMCAAAPVTIEMLPAAHVGCTCVCSGATSAGPMHPPIPGPQPPILKGSATVLIHGMPAARWAPAPDLGACGVFLGDAKLAALRTVLIGDVGLGQPGATAGGAVGVVAEPEACFACRESLAAEGLAHPDPAVQAAAEDLKRLNHDLEHAKLAQHVYDVHDPDPNKRIPPPGWKNISNDADALAKYGLKPQMLENPAQSEFRAQMYVPDPAIFGNSMKPTIVFKGTSPTSTEDWKNNAQQAFNLESNYYESAVEIGNKVGDTGQEVEISGHSLGGGMASAASSASGANATTFNAAGLHSKTVERYDGTPSDSKINAYRVEGEFLTGAQEQSAGGDFLGAAIGGVLLGNPLAGFIGKRILSDILPDAAGAKHDLPGHGLSPIARHGMVQVVPAIASQAANAQQVLTEATGHSCTC